MLVVPVFAAKVVGTMSIGVWAGYNSSLSHSPPDGADLRGAASVWTRFFRRRDFRRLSFAQMKQDSRTFVAEAHGSCGCAAQDDAKCACNNCEGSCTPKTGAKSAKSACKCADPRSATGKNSENRAKSVPVAAQGSSFTAEKSLALSVRASHVSVSSGVAFAANFFAYTAASASGKHPYSSYLALGAPLVGASQFYGARKSFAQASVFANNAKSARNASSKSQTSSESEEDAEIVGDLSSSTYEHVKHPESHESAGSHESRTPDSSEKDAASKHQFTLENKYSIFSTVVAGLSTFSYLISVVGLAGDPGRS